MKLKILKIKCSLFLRGFSSQKAKNYLDDVVYCEATYNELMLAIKCAKSLNEMREIKKVMVSFLPMIDFKIEKINFLAVQRLIIAYEQKEIRLYPKAMRTPSLKTA